MWIFFFFRTQWERQYKTARGRERPKGFPPPLMPYETGHCPGPDGQALSFDEVEKGVFPMLFV